MLCLSWRSGRRVLAAGIGAWLLGAPVREIAAPAAPVGVAATASVPAPDGGYVSELDIPYCEVEGHVETLNAFLPRGGGIHPAMVEIHGGWWSGGKAARSPQNVGGHQVFMRHGLAIFSINYRLGEAGGFPQAIRDCRNAIRFIRRHAQRFQVDPERIAVCGGSAGGHLSLMAAMVPENFDDGGPTPGLERVSARVCGSFSYIPPTDFVRFWSEAPDDVFRRADGGVAFRRPDPRIPNDARPRFRLLFHGVVPDSVEHVQLYTRMCPIGYVRKDIPPLLICDGERDPIVPGLEGKELYEKLVAADAPVTYWMTPSGGHRFPSGAGFDAVLEAFMGQIFRPVDHPPRG